MAVPERSTQAADLVVQLNKQGLAAAMHVDATGAGPWYTAKRCWRSMPGHATHQLMLQDDAILCHNFVAGMKAVAAVRPNDPLALFAADDEHADYAAMGGHHWMPMLRFGAVALLLPRHVIEDFLAWQQPLEKHFDESTRGDGASLRWGLLDDCRLWRYLMYQSIRMWATVPSLVDHDVSLPSCIDIVDPLQSRGVFASASNFLGEGNPTDIDWRL